MHEMNEERAAWAHNAIDVFCVETYGGRDFAACLRAGDPDAVIDGDGGCAIQDLISDLMHLAEMNGMDPHELVRRGVASYEYESDPDYQGD